VSTTFLAVVATAQLAFFVAMFAWLVVYRGLDERRKRRRRAQGAALSRALMDLLAGRITPDQFVGTLGRSDGHVIVAVLHQYASQIGGEPWERVVDAVRQTAWFDRFVPPRARSRLWWQRLVAARLLAIAGRESDLSLTRELVRDHHPAIKVAAIKIVRRVRDDSVLEIVLDEALAAKPVVRRYLFDTVVSVRQVLVPLLARRLETAGSVEELRSLIALGGELSAIEFFDPLLGYTGHEAMEIRVAVARALGSYPHPRTEAVLSDLLSDKQWQVRTQAGSSLGVIRAVGARGALKRALSDGNWWVRLRAAMALRQLGGAGTQVLHDIEAGEDRFALEMARYVRGLSDEAVADYLT
jgi:hypothetical protein